MRLLLVEDSVRLAQSLQAGLRKLGHAVDVVHDGVRGLSYARNNPYEVLVLDVMLPGLDGLEVVRRLRADGRDTHVLLLTARDAVADRVAGLSAGADDYLVKPFAFEELAARIDALGRRTRLAGNPLIEVGDLRIDTSARTVTRAGRPIVLSRREYRLLACLARRAGQVVSRIEIEDGLYDEDTFPNSNVVAAAICTLRDKLEEHGGTRLVHTRRGLGYVLAEQTA